MASFNADQLGNQPPGPLVWILCPFVLVLAFATCAQAQNTPVDRIQRGNSKIIIDPGGDVQIAPRPDRGLTFLPSTITPPVSSPGQARIYFDHLSGVLRISTNGGPYLVMTNPNSGTGTVSSVALALPGIFTVTGSPVTTAGTLAAGLVAQPARSFFAGPSTGANAAPLFRIIEPTDVPALDVSKLTSGVLPLVRGGTGIDAYTFGDMLFANGANQLARLPGNTTAARRFLAQTGDATFSGVPAWSTIDLASGATGGITGTLPIANGGTGLTSLSTANRLLGINNAATGLEYKTLQAGSNLAITHSANAITIDASGTLAARYSNITAPEANRALTMGSFTTSFTWGAATGANTNLFSLTDSASNTGTGYLFNVATATASNVRPLRITARGTIDGLEMLTDGSILHTHVGNANAYTISARTGRPILQIGTPTGNTTGSTINFVKGGSTEFQIFSYNAGNRKLVLLDAVSNNETFAISGTSAIVTGNMSVSGSLSKGSGTFLIDHPLDANNTNLYHGFVEAPRYDLIYRGSARLNRGTISASIDDASRMRAGTFVALTRNAQCWVQNVSGFDPLRCSINNQGEITITTNNGQSTDSVNWLVVAERADPFIRTVNNVDAQGQMVPEQPKPEVSAARATQLLAPETRIIEADDEAPDQTQNEVVPELVGTRGYPLHADRTSGAVPQRRITIRTRRRTR